MKKTTLGFSLIEVLVVMVIIGILVSILLPNVVGMRNRAQDARIKSELNQLKTALQLYYSDFQNYPLAGTGVSVGLIMGCGDGGVWACNWGDEFSANIDGTKKMYMERLPRVNSTIGSIAYSQPPDDDQTYVIGVTLENASDKDIEESQQKCLGDIDDPPTTVYYVCP